MLPWSVLLGGERFACPCCGGRFRRLRAYRTRPGARCPRCGSLERHRTLWLYLERSSVLLSDGLRILHLAPEPVLERRLRTLPDVDYVGADLNPRRGQTRADVTALPFPEESFDFVLCSHVLEHVHDDRAAMAELFRVLAPGGRVVLQQPIDQARPATFEDPSVRSAAERRRVYGQKDHVRVYGRDFDQRLERAGFEVQVTRPEQLGSDDLVVRFGLRKSRVGPVSGEDVYVGIKPGTAGRRAA